MLIDMLLAKPVNRPASARPGPLRAMRFCYPDFRLTCLRRRFFPSMMLKIFSIFPDLS